MKRLKTKKGRVMVQGCFEVKKFQKNFNCIFLATKFLPNPVPFNNFISKTIADKDLKFSDNEPDLLEY